MWFEIWNKLLFIFVEIQRELNKKGKNQENPNVRILSNTLKKMLEEKGDDSRAMVFVKARATCKSLAAFLDRDLGNIGVRASPLWGKDNRGGDDGKFRFLLCLPPRKLFYHKLLKPLYGLNVKRLGDHISLLALYFMRINVCQNMVLKQNFIAYDTIFMIF